MRTNRLICLASVSRYMVIQDIKKDTTKDSTIERNQD